LQVSGPEEEAIFQIPYKLGPADAESIKESDFVPDMPTDVLAEEGANSVSLSWKNSDCAEAYEINYIESGASTGHVTLALQDGSTEINLSDMKPCTSYDISLYAILGDKYSEEKSYKIATKPRLDALSDLEPTIQTTMDALSLRWAAWENVSCIKEYDVKVCAVATSECRETERVSKQAELPDVTYEASELTPCTEYTVEIQPLFPDTEVEPKVFAFKTSSPSADTQSISAITAEPVSSGRMRVDTEFMPTAPPAKKAGSLPRNRRDLSRDRQHHTLHNLQLCVSAVLDEEESPKTISEEVTSDLDEEHAFEAPELQVINGDQ
ncbi:Fibronectinlike, partial [Caligus rogercresseyi]